MAIENKRVAIIVGPEFQYEETVETANLLKQAGVQTTYVGLEKEKLFDKHGEKEIMIESTIEEVHPDDFNALVIPGGHSPENFARTKEQSIS